MGDYMRTILYFILYDWDGASPSEDDFLGSAHLVLNKVISLGICSRKGGVGLMSL